MGKRMYMVFLVLVGLGGCGLLSETNKVRQPYLGAAAIIAPTPAVRVLVSRDARDQRVQVVESIALVAPDGRRYTPRPDQQKISRQPYSYTTLPGLRGSGNASQLPDTLGVSSPSQRRSEFINISALIDIPDVEGYRRLSDQWTIAVVFSGAKGRKKKITIPAPPID